MSPSTVTAPYYFFSPGQSPPSYFSRKMRFSRISLALALAAACSSEASHDFNNNGGSPSSSNYFGSSSFVYSEMEVFSENDDMGSVTPYNEQVGGTSNSYVSYSTTTTSAPLQEQVEDDENDISLDEMMMDLTQEESEILEEYLKAKQEQKEEEEDDDEDDDDDGSSSMLSNASLKRSSKSATSGDGSYVETFLASSYTAYGEGSSSNMSERQVALKMNQSSRSSLNAALSVRGGASAAGSVSNELTKKLIVAAIVTLVFEGCIGHVLELFKIVMQTSPPGTSYGDVYRQITSNKGVAGMWDGFAPWGVIQAVLKGGVFGLAHSIATKTLVPIAEDGKIPMQLALTMAGGIGGGFQGYVLSPTLLLKTRVMTNPVFREKMSVLKTTLLSFKIGGEVIKNEGILTLMKGSNVFATKRVFDWASRYYFADLCEAIFTSLKGSALSATERSISSLLGGVLSTVVTLPLDVLVAKTQDAKKAGVKVSAVKLFMEELNEKGLSGLKDSYMQGFEARLLHVCLTTVVIKTLAPIVYQLMYGPK